MFSDIFKKIVINLIFRTLGILKKDKDLNIVVIEIVLDEEEDRNLNSFLIALSSTKKDVNNVVLVKNQIPV